MWSEILHLIEHSLIDSAKVLLIVFLFYILFSFIETKLSNLLKKNKKVSPLIGASLGLIPQCGFSVLAADLYQKKHLTLGTLLAVFIACSDEALPILLSSQDKILSVIPLVLIKFVLAISVGLIIDFILSKQKKEVHHHFHECKHTPVVHIGCCNHTIDDEKESKIKKHLIHPLLHSLKIFIYVLVINFIFSLLVHFIGEDSIASFLSHSKYLAPLFAVLIGLIPNCASSVIITNLYLIDGISFGACLAGLIVNAGLGMVYLLKKKENLKDTFKIFILLITIAVVSGYIALLVEGLWN